jgi:hypothetical protein
LSIGGTALLEEPPAAICRLYSIMNKGTDEGSSRFLRNIADYLPDYTVDLVMNANHSEGVCNVILNTVQLTGIVVTV